MHPNIETIDCNTCTDDNLKELKELCIASIASFHGVPEEEVREYIEKRNKEDMA